MNSSSAKFSCASPSPFSRAIIASIFLSMSSTLFPSLFERQSQATGFAAIPTLSDHPRDDENCSCGSTGGNPVISAGTNPSSMLSNERAEVLTFPADIYVSDWRLSHPGPFNNEQG